MNEDQFALVLGDGAEVKKSLEEKGSSLAGVYIRPRLNETQSKLWHSVEAAHLTYITAFWRDILIPYDKVQLFPRFHE